MDGLSTLVHEDWNEPLDEPVFAIPAEDISEEGSVSEDDTFPASRLSYGDLVFTLINDRSKYFRPSVSFDGSLFRVEKDWLFYSAARDAGLPEIFCNVLDEESALSFGYEKPRFSDVNVFRRFAFFDSGIVIPFYELGTELKFHWDGQCLEYVNEDPPQSIKARFDRFLHMIENKGGKVRSVDGIRPYE